MTDSVRVGDLTIGGGRPLVLIAGPCVIESLEHCLFLAEEIAAVARRVGVGLIFKASFDKANRTSVSAYRGPGLEKGLAILGRTAKALNLPVTSDIHEPAQAAPAADVLDLLQIPAFLCRQTDLLTAAGRTGKPVNVKKGQFVSPSEMKNVVDKLAEAGCADVMLTERGTFFGYNRLVNDMRGLAVMREFGKPVVFDATHSVQLPGGDGRASGGEPQFIAPLARAAAAVGIDALFLEVHEEPAKAPSDSTSMLPLAELEELLSVVVEIDRTVKKGNR